MLNIVFDMDGVIFDTETVCLGVWQSVADEFGFKRVDEVFQMCIGCNRTYTIDILKNTQEPGFLAESFLERASEEYHRVIKENGIPVKTGAKEIFMWLRSQGARVAVASSTKLATVEYELKMAGLYEYFDVIVGGDLVKKSKPEPDIYLHACHLLGAEPESCFAIEDSYNGIRAASGAGMRALMVPDRLAPTAEMERLAEAILPDLYMAKRYIAEHM